MRTFIKPAFSALFVIALAACNGDSESSSPQAPQQPSNLQPSTSGYNAPYTGQLLLMENSSRVSSLDLNTGNLRALTKIEASNPAWLVAMDGSRLVLVDTIQTGNGLRDGWFRYRFFETQSGQQVEQWDNQTGRSLGLLPQLSPDGAMIVGGVFQYQWGDSHLLARDRNGNTLFDFTEAGYDHGFAFLPDGRMVAIDGNGWLSILSRSFAVEQRIYQFADTRLPGNMRASPDGKRLAFIWYNHVHVINLDGSGLHQVSDSVIDDFGVNWSPDSQRLLISNGDGNATCSSLYIVSPNENKVLVEAGTNDTRATPIKAIDPQTGRQMANCYYPRAYWTR